MIRHSLIALLSLAAMPLLGQTSSPTNGPTRALDPLVTNPAVWDMSPEQFEQTFASARFDWLSEKKEGARFFGPGLSLWNDQVKVAEAIIEFTSGKVARMNFSIYNRGDSSQLIVDRKAFEQRVADLRDAITKQLGVTSAERPKNNATAVASEGFVWTKTPSAFLLEYSFQREVKTRGIDFRAEFIRLRAVSIGAGGSPAAAPAAAVVAKSSLVENVKHQENGDVVILNVPMVDQGPKGYCAVATAERVFRYYGIPVDQHEMAQAADTSDGGGTSPDKMFEALNKLENRFRVRVRAVEDWDYQKFVRFMDDYNREAKRDGKAEVDVRNYQYASLTDIYARMDGATLQKAKVEKDKSGYGKFQRNVQGLIDRGIPVMWSVTVGMLPEPAIPQGGIGGHMRLIIGYNSKTEEILFSDSWGAEHALKRMPTAQAFAIMNGMYYMEPMK